MEPLLSLFVSFFLAFLVGFERQISKKPAGFAPYVFVTVMSTALSLAALSYFSSDAAPVFNGIIAGIGFLGAGALIRYHEKVFGFTTAAAIWGMAALGMVIALSDSIVLILLAYLLIWITLGVDKLIEKKGLGRHLKTAMIQIESLHEGIETKKFRETIKRYKDEKEESLEVNFEKGYMEYKFYVPENTDVHELLSEFSGFKHIRRIHVE
ncbi:MAG: MgtC/SapB family protein [Candidatus ainarchaeum sp.]|nr:MgtC/SapB family protein [Candidatus ainarchaeum sp.]